MQSVLNQLIFIQSCENIKQRINQKLMKINSIQESTYQNKTEKVE